MNQKVFITLNVRIEEKFTDLTSKLKALHFHLSRNGSLIWTNEFNRDQQLSIKPMTENSPIHAVNFIGPTDNLSAILQQALGTFENSILMFRYIYSGDTYNNETYRQLAASNPQWKDVGYNDFVFNCPHKEFVDFACLLEHNQMTFQTRSIKRIAQVNTAVSFCNDNMKIFHPSQPFDLFTYEEFEQATVLA